jgi:hypothetical protein
MDDSQGKGVTSEYLRVGSQPITTKNETKRYMIHIRDSVGNMTESIHERERIIHERERTI